MSQTQRNLVLPEDGACFCKTITCILPSQGPPSRNPTSNARYASGSRAERRVARSIITKVVRPVATHTSPLKTPCPIAYELLPTATILVPISTTAGQCNYRR